MFRVLSMTFGQGQDMAPSAWDTVPGQEPCLTSDSWLETDVCIHRHNPVLVWYDSRDGPTA